MRFAALRERLPNLREKLPDFRDLHIYGGLALAAGFGYAALGPAAVAVAGAVLWYMGVWRLD